MEDCKVNCIEEYEKYKDKDMISTNDNVIQKILSEI
jgi:hypothetical protein